MSSDMVRQVLAFELAQTGVSDPRLMAVGSKLARSIGIDPDMTVGELARRLTIAERALSCEPIGLGPFVKFGPNAISHATSEAEVVRYVIVNGADGPDTQGAT